MLDRLPNLFIIGAAKAGTTTVYSALGQHRGVYLPYDKEPGFFSTDSEFQRGLEYYADSLYRNAGSFPVRVDASTEYLFWAEKVAPRIKNAYGDAKVSFMVMFRDPVERAYSWYWNARADGEEDLPFSESIALEAQRYRKSGGKFCQRGLQRFGYYRGGCYATNLRPFLERFPKHCFVFVLTDDLRTDFGGTFDRVFKFLGLPGQRVKPLHSNRAAQPINRTLTRFLRNPAGLLPGLIRPIYRHVPFATRYRLKAIILDSLMRPVRYPPMNVAVERDLRERFAPEVRALAEIIGRDLSAWLPQ